MVKLEALVVSIQRKWGLKCHRTGCIVKISFNLLNASWVALEKYHFFDFFVSSVNRRVILE
jgi:hypothetical protein